MIERDFNRGLEMLRVNFSVRYNLLWLNFPNELHTKVNLWVTFSSKGSLAVGGFICPS